MHKVKIVDVDGTWDVVGPATSWPGMLLVGNGAITALVSPRDITCVRECPGCLDTAD